MENKQKEFDELSFTDDFMFCKVLVNNPDICKELVEMIVGRKVKTIVNPDNQKTIDMTSDGKGVRLDVYFEDQENVVYNIEMQTTNPGNLPKRSRYYQGVIDLNIIEKGADYSELKDNYIIFICTSDVIGKGRHLYSFDNVCSEDNSIHLNDGTHKVFLCAGAEADDVSDKAKRFLDYLAGKMSDDSFVKRIDEAVHQVREHEEWRAEYMTLMMRDRQKIAEGRAEERANSISKMLLNGASREQVKEFLNATDEEIDAVLQQNKTPTLG